VTHEALHVLSSGLKAMGFSKRFGTGGDRLRCSGKAN